MFRRLHLHFEGSQQFPTNCRSSRVRYAIRQQFPRHSLLQLNRGSNCFGKPKRRNFILRDSAAIFYLRGGHFDSDSIIVYLGKCISERTPEPGPQCRTNRL